MIGRWAKQKAAVAALRLSGLTWDHAPAHWRDATAVRLEFNAT
jgi:hypothetical protein